MNNKISVITKFIFIFVLFIIINNIAKAATHEIGIGASFINKNEDFKYGLGFDIFYDYMPGKSLVLRTEFGSQFSDKLPPSSRWSSNNSNRIPILGLNSY